MKEIRIIKPIVLIGMMGAGKSSLGTRLAERLKLAFVDADTEIETAAGMSVAEIFEAHGEAAFRDGERRVIARLLKAGPQVLALGGGAFWMPIRAPKFRTRRFPYGSMCRSMNLSSGSTQARQTPTAGEYGCARQNFRAHA